MPKGEIVSVFVVGNCFWQPYLCLKANIQMMYFSNMLSMIIWYKSRSSFMKIRRLLQGVPEGVSEGVPAILRRRRYLRDLKYPDMIRISILSLIT